MGCPLPSGNTFGREIRLPLIIQSPTDILFFFLDIRLGKEVKVYEKETAQLEEKLAKLKSDGAEEWDIKNAVSSESHFWW